MTDATTTSLDALALDDLTRIENALDALAGPLGPADAAPRDHGSGDVAPPPSGLSDIVGYAVSGGGKRLRPLLCVAGWRAASAVAHAPVPDAVLDLACALELIHGYSLVHDDLPSMDDARLRRGRPAAHRVYGSRRAALAGMAMIPLAAAVLDRGARALGLSPAERARLTRELARGAGAEGMVGGQVLDLAAEGGAIDLERLERIHRAKTGALLVASIRIGALGARAEPRVLAALTAYASALGLAFQIADDLLDVTGRPDVTGKVGRDEEQAKATYVAFLGIDGARRRGRAEAEAAVRALREAGLDAPVLAALARFAIERDR